jgi:hypothetical protein
MEPGTNVVLLADPWERGVGHIVLSADNGRLLVHWESGDEPFRAWHRAEDVECFDAWMPALSPADMIELGVLPPRESA